MAYATGLIEEKCKAKLVDAVAQGITLQQLIDDEGSHNPDIIVVDSSYASWRNDIDSASKVKEAVPHGLLVMAGPPTRVCGLDYLKNNSV